MPQPAHLTITTPPLRERLLRGDLAIIFYFAVARLILHLAININGGYGLFRDELYYLACGDHLAMGYVDQPPLSIFVLKLFTTLFGNSLFVVRLPAAICGASMVFLTGLMTIQLGGKKFAQVVSGLCSCSLITIGMNSIYSMNSIDVVIWAWSDYLVMQIIIKGNKETWITLGIVLGLGLLNKISVLFLGLGIFVGLIATRHRHWLATVWPYVAGVIAFVLFLPYIIWNVQHDMAHLEFIRNASSGKYSGLTAGKFIKDQILNNPIAFPVWLAGLLCLFFHDNFKNYRWLGFLFFIPLLILTVNGTSKAEYLVAAYSILWPAGAIWWENATSKKILKYTARPLWVLGQVILTFVFLPVVVAVLPVEKEISYAKALGQTPSSPESMQLADLPQHFADMFGWKEKARDVAKVFNTLSKDEQKHCAIIGGNYGNCSAIDYYGEALGLPKAIGKHNNYWIWGPRDYNGDILIIMGGNYEDHVDDFESVQEMLISDCEYCMPYEDNMKIFLCRGLKGDVKDVWPEEKHYE